MGVSKIISDVKSAGNGLPNGYELKQNYPNPFNPSTTISFTIPKQEVVALKVYDILGRLVTTLVNEEKSAGTYKVEFTTNHRPPTTNLQLSSGVYFYQLKAGILMQTKKMMLLK